MATLAVDTSQTDALNLQVLQRQDNQIAEIVGTASHVVVYEFDQVEASWKRKEVEGSLFVVKRYTTPRFQVFVNNRLSTVNMAIGIDPQLNVDNVDEFLIIRCANPSATTGFKIYGIWFFPEADRQKTLKLLERILATVKNGDPAKLSPKPDHHKQHHHQQQKAAHATQNTSRDTKGAQSFGPIGSPKRASNKKTLSEAEGNAAGKAILGMISQNEQSVDEEKPSSQGDASANGRKNRPTNADVFALQEVNIGQRYGQHTQLQETLSTALNTPYSVFASPGARWYIEQIPYLGVLMSGAKNPLAQWAYDGYAWFNERFLASILGRHTQTVYHNEWLKVILYGLLGSGWVFGTSLLAREDKSPENNDILLIGDWRAAQCVEITLENKHKMLITNVHLSSAPDQENIRMHEMQLVCDWIQEKLALNPELQTAIIMGDFNCHPNGDCYNFIASQGYKSAYFTAHGKEPEVTFHQGLEAPTKDVGEPCTLDYIFIKGDKVHVDDIKVIGQSQCDQDSTLYPSDHFGLVANFSLIEN
ncbi:hypothetical protein THRCLA_22393 [Thraustotheca clavata]|uniref:Endonuclease/exonuclease/phosphatase domain-containing protein n=1 Tax=Thraustotheca clavata TaxID=74557 RepID=A0A1V9Z2X0_9STRA|nr:hypothetical protein THRCLA_22393 [Thraustotheca clavata]